MLTIIVLVQDSKFEVKLRIQKVADKLAPPESCSVSQSGDRNLDHSKSFYDAIYIANCTALHDSSALRLAKRPKCHYNFLNNNDSNKTCLFKLPKK